MRVETLLKTAVLLTIVLILSVLAFKVHKDFEGGKEREMLKCVSKCQQKHKLDRAVQMVLTDATHIGPFGMNRKSVYNLPQQFDEE